MVLFEKIKIFCSSELVSIFPINLSLTFFVKLKLIVVLVTLHSYNSVFNFKLNVLFVNSLGMFDFPFISTLFPDIDISSK